MTQPNNPTMTQASNWEPTGGGDSASRKDLVIHPSMIEMGFPKSRTNNVKGKSNGKMASWRFGICRIKDNAVALVIVSTIMKNAGNDTPAD